MMTFLASLPEGPAWGRMKWGNKEEPGAGRGRKDRVLERFSTLADMCSAPFEEFLELFDDEVVGRSLYHFLRSQRGQDTIQRLREVGVDFTTSKPKRVLGSTALLGKAFVVTGTLNKYSRDQAHEMIRAHGGKPTSSVSKSTDYLVVGSNPGTKLEKAVEFGVQILNEDQFQNMVEQGT